MWHTFSYSLSNIDKKLSPMNKARHKRIHLLYFYHINVTFSTALEQINNTTETYIDLTFARNIQMR